ERALFKLGDDEVRQVEQQRHAPPKERKPAARAAQRPGDGAKESQRTDVGAKEGGRLARGQKSEVKGKPPRDQRRPRPGMERSTEDELAEFGIGPQEIEGIERQRRDASIVSDRRGGRPPESEGDRQPKPRPRKSARKPAQRKDDDAASRGLPEDLIEQARR